MKNFQSLQQKYLVNTYPNRGLSFIKGEGVFLYTENGDKYLDMMTNYGVNILGYNNPEVNKALIKQLNKLSTLHCSFNNDVRALASQSLISRVAQDYKKVYWANSGTAAMEAALKFAVMATNKRKFIACKNAYHGKTLGSLSATFSKKYKEQFEPLLWNFNHIDFDNADALEKYSNDETAAFIVEPIQGESGIQTPQNGYLKRVREICDKKGILLIFDEIQTGTGRTGKFLASHHENMGADILCLGKGLAGGMAVGVTITNSKVINSITKLSHTSTFGGNPLVCAGVKVVLDILDENLQQQIEKKGLYFLSLLKEIKSDLIVEVRGKGLMIGVEVKDKRNELLKRLQQEKILAIPAGEDVVRFLPSYIIENQHIENVVEKLNRILKTI